MTAVASNNDDAPDCPDCNYPIYETPCHNCKDIKADKDRKNKHINALWGGDRVVRDFTFERLKKTPANQRALAVVKSWEPANKNLYFFGGTGVGKTHMAVAAARVHWVPDDGYKPFWSLAEIALELRTLEAYGQRDLLKQLVAQKIIIIDDLGIESFTDHERKALYNIVNGRDNYGHAGLIITSNMEIDDLKDAIGDNRVTSRLSRNTILVNLTDEQDQRTRAGRG